MTSLLKELSVAIGLLGSDHVPVADADGWKGYVWHVRPADTCEVKDDRGFCEIVTERWDWKRLQYFSLSLRLESEANAFTARFKLDNQDALDKDNVCAVALFLDNRNRQIGIFYQNWVAVPNRIIARDVPLTPSFPASDVRTVAVGAKQCDPAAKPDVDYYMRTRRMLRRD